MGSVEVGGLRVHWTPAKARIQSSLSSNLSSSASHAVLWPRQHSLQLQGWKSSTERRRCHPQAPRARATAEFPSEAPLEDPTQTWWMSPSKRRSRQEAQGVPALLVKRSIRQYEELSHPGSVVIMGNVAPGASVKAGGDIIVLGRLAGTAYAGAGGNPDAVVVALTMEPALIGINNRIFSGPDGGASPYPEVASVSPSGAICIEPLQGSPTARVAPGAGTPDPVMALIARQNFVNVNWNIEGLKGRGKRWQAPAVASAITGLYITLAGILVMVAPLYTFGLFFGAQPISKGWIRLLGILATAFGIYYLGATYGDAAGLGVYGFYAATVVGRTFIFISFCLLVWAGELPVAALLLGIVNLIGAVSMLLALQKQQQ